MTTKKIGQAAKRFSLNRVGCDCPLTPKIHQGQGLSTPWVPPAAAVPFLSFPPSISPRSYKLHSYTPNDVTVTAAMEEVALLQSRPTGGVSRNVLPSSHRSTADATLLFVVDRTNSLEASCSGTVRGIAVATRRHVTVASVSLKAVFVGLSERWRMSSRWSRPHIRHPEWQCQWTLLSLSSRLLGIVV